MLALVEKMEADIPECMFETETENFLRDYDNRLRMQGLDLATYFKYTGMNLDMMRAQLRPQAEQQVKVRLALEKIAELEAITVSAEDIAAEYARISEAYNMPEEEVRKLVDEAGVTEDLRVKAAAEFVKSHAVAVAEVAAKKVTKKTTTKKAAEGETAEKKPAAKKTTTSSTAKKTTTTKKVAEGETAEEKPAAKKATTAKKTTTSTTAKKTTTSTTKKTTTKKTETTEQ